MSHANMDLRVFQETKVTRGIYTQESSGYMVVATEALSAHSDGIDIFYRRAEHLLVKALQNYGANVVRFLMATKTSSNVEVLSGAK